MDTIKKEKLVCLKEICEEKQRVWDEESGKYVIRRACFSSMQAMIEGAFQFVAFFEALHKKGCVYGSDSPEPFWFSLDTGELTANFHEEALNGGGLFSDTRDVAVGESVDVFEAGTPQREKRSIFLSEFLAPELIWEMEEQKETSEEVSGELTFTVETDRYFMSVFLFEYFFHTGSPFEGKKMVNRCFLSPMEKEKFRAREGKFCMDAGDHDNKPVTGIQDKLIYYWKEYPEILHKMFQKAFMDSGTLCELRPTEVDWKYVLVHMAMNYKECGCGFRGFSDRLRSKENGTFACPGCGKIYYPLINGMERILLSQGEKLYECQTGTDPFDKSLVTGMIAENKQHKGLYGIKNMSQAVWRGAFPNGTVKEIANGQGIPIWNGLMIRFESGEEWSLRLIQKTEEREDEENE